MTRTPSSSRAHPGWLIASLAGGVSALLPLLSRGMMLHNL